MSVFQVCVLGITAVMLALCLSEIRPEYGMYLSIVCCLIISSRSLAKVQTFLDLINTFTEYISLDGAWLSILIKILGIAYVAEFSSALCRDAGHGAVAEQIQMFAKLTILALSAPVITALLELIGEMGH